MCIGSRVAWTRPNPKRSNVAAPLSVNQGEPMGRWEDVARLFGLDRERKKQRKDLPVTHMLPTVANDRNRNLNQGKLETHSMIVMQPTTYIPWFMVVRTLK